MNNQKIIKIMYGEEMIPFWFYESDESVIMEWMSDSVTEDIIVRIVKAAQVFFGKSVYPRSGEKPFSRKGVLSDEHRMDIEMSEY